MNTVKMAMNTRQITMNAMQLHLHAKTSSDNNPKNVNV
jgi:hypothetical protein